ncbi:MAG TPA: hypothetical protein VKY81_09905 [Natronosporangium sp.]|nr:hypothetical protein [Natronosporangium sp.]
MSKRDLPAAVYAAAGAGDLALRRLRRLNRSAGRTVRAAAGAATDLRGRATDLRERMTDLRERASDLRGRASGLRERATALRSYRIDRARVDAELARLRESARRGGTMLVTGAAAAQERAVDGYRRLVAHGRRVMSGTGTVSDEPVAAPLPAAAEETADMAADGTAAGRAAEDEAAGGERSAA